MVRLAISQRRELLLEAAWRVMIKDGVTAATTRAICAEAGMPQSSFHYCFDSRADLLKLVVTSRVPTQIALASEAFGEAASGDRSVQDALAGYWKDVVENPDRHAVLYDITMTSYYDAELAELRQVQYREFHEGALAVLELATRNGAYAWDLDMSALAVGLVAFLDGITLRYVVDPATPGLEEALLAYGDDLASHLHPVAD